MNIIQLNINNGIARLIDNTVFVFTVILRASLLKEKICFFGLDYDVYQFFRGDTNFVDPAQRIKLRCLGF